MSLSAARVAKGTAYITVQNILTSAMGIVFYVVAARNLTPSDIGAIASLQFATSIYTTVSLLALQTTATKYMSEEIGRGRPDVAAAIALQTLKIVVVSSGFFLFVMHLFSGSLAGGLLGDPSQSLIFTLALLSAFFGILKQMYVSFLQGVQRLDLFAKTHLVTAFVSSGLAIVAVILGYGLTGVVTAWFVSQIIGSLLSALFYRGCLSGSGVQSYPIKKLFSFAAPLQLLGLIGLVSNWSDRMIFLALTGSLSDLGIYDLAVRGSTTLAMIPYAIGIALLPAFSELYGRSGKQGMSRAAELSTRYLAYLIFPTAVGLAAISRTSITFLFGEAYSRAGLPLTILSITYIMTAYSVIFTTALQAIGETKVFIKIGLAAMITQTSLVTLFSPFIGMLGPTIARAAMQFVGFAYPLYELGRRMNVEIDVKAAAKAVSASFLMALPVTLVDQWLMDIMTTPYRFLLDVVLGILLYTILAILFRLLERRDIDLLRQIAPNGFDFVIDVLEKTLTR